MQVVSLHFPKGNTHSTGNWTWCLWWHILSKSLAAFYSTRTWVKWNSKHLEIPASTLSGSDVTIAYVFRSAVWESRKIRKMWTLLGMYCEQFEVADKENAGKALYLIFRGISTIKENPTLFIETVEKVSKDKSPPMKDWYLWKYRFIQRKSLNWVRMVRKEFPCS